MLNAGGHASTAARREVDLYVTVDDVDEMFARVLPCATATASGSLSGSRPAAATEEGVGPWRACLRVLGR